MTDQPADLLTAAAQRLREAAAAATPGPWRIGDTHLGQYGYTATVLTDREELRDTDLVAWLPSMSQTPWDATRNVWATSDWIALMHPGVGLALVDWLDAAAVEMRAVADTEYEGGEFATWDAALAVARAVLGQNGGQQ